MRLYLLKILFLYNQFLYRFYLFIQVALMLLRAALGYSYLWISIIPMEMEDGTASIFQAIGYVAY